MPSVRKFALHYDVLNGQGTFSEGDTITGNVSLSLERPTRVKCVAVKVKGDADVQWTERAGNEDKCYSEHKRFFGFKKHLIPEKSKDTLLSEGTHRYNFRFQIPPGSLPSSFQGKHGKIVYLLEAKLSRSWKMDRKVIKELKFVSKSIPNIRPLMSSHFAAVEKEVGFFSKGSVRMDVIIGRKAYAPGETVDIVAKVKNSSSKKMKPIFILKQKVVYRVKHTTNACKKDIRAMAGPTIRPNTRETVTCPMRIPADQAQSIHNCDMISVEYSLKVYLDISFAFNPEVQCPLIIVPASLTAIAQSSAAIGPSLHGTFGGPSNSDFHPHACSARPCCLPSAQGARGYPAASGSNSAGPIEPPPPYLATLHQPLTAPPIFQQEGEPPSYASLFPSSATETF